jgi:two-component system, cell cycle response regulator DivK
MKRIAVIEDSADNRLLLNAILEDRYEIEEYETGPEGLSGITASRPDVVLLDISLPGMDGVEVVRRIRADAALKDLPVIALTAHAMAGDREKYLASGFSDYVSKPIVDEQLLFDAIDRWMPQS